MRVVSTADTAADVAARPLPSLVVRLRAVVARGQAAVSNGRRSTMLKALVPVDGSENSLSAVRHVIKLIEDREPIDVHLLNVQPPMRSDITTFVPEKAVHDFHVDEGRKALRPACELLDAAGIRYATHVYVGPAAEVIAACARQLGCDEVIMGTHGYGTVAQLLLGSVSHEAIHQMDPHIPVTLVKGGYAPLHTPAPAATSEATR
jgi:nucleotide-binding universal stress UspA family protein